MRRMLAPLVLVVATAGCTSSAAAPTTSAVPTNRSSHPPATSGVAPSTTASVTGSPAPASSAPTEPRVPPLSAAARAAGLVDIRRVVPNAVIDLRYATANNFVGFRVYPKDARCLVHRSMVPGLRVASRALRRQGYALVFWDCYRPHRVQVRMFQLVPDPNWVARPGPYATSHEAGRSVDVTLARAKPAAQCPPGRRVRHRCLLVMGTGFDAFTPRAYAFATTGVSATARANRALLRNAMAAGGLSVYPGEWWHFDGPGSGTPRPHLHAPLR